MYTKPDWRVDFEPDDHFCRLGDRGRCQARKYGKLRTGLTRYRDAHLVKCCID